MTELIVKGKERERPVSRGNSHPGKSPFGCQGKRLKDRYGGERTTIRMGSLQVQEVKKTTEQKKKNTQVEIPGGEKKKCPRGKKTK